MNADQRRVIEELLADVEYDWFRWKFIKGGVQEQRARALRALFDAYNQTAANLTATQAHATALLERARAAEAVLADVLRMWPGMTVGALAWMPVDARDVKQARAILAARGTGQTPGAVERTQHCPLCEHNAKAARDAEAKLVVAYADAQRLCVTATRERDEARADAAREHDSALAYCKTATGYQEQIAGLRQEIQRVEAQRDDAWEALRESTPQRVRELQVELREERGKAWRAWREVALVEPLFVELGRFIADAIEGRMGGGR